MVCFFRRSKMLKKLTFSNFTELNCKQNVNQQPISEGFLVEISVKDQKPRCALHRAYP